MKANPILGVLAIGGSLLALFVACSVGDVDFSNKACPCGSGYVCDAARNVCVASVSSIANDGAPSGEGGQACAGENCPCNLDADCRDPERSHCGPGKTCVECIPAPDSCRPGSYCNAANQCVLGCKVESDCAISPAAPHCDTVRHQCVACRTIADCTDADQCSPSGECVQGCDLDAGKLCPAGKECCQGLCIDTKKDPFNCGGCNVACSTQNATPTCVASVCTWACANGYAHCGTENTGCETNTRTDPLHCGSCERDCTPLVANADGIKCEAGQCAYASCNTNFDDCDGQKGNGCECACGTKKNERCCPGNVCNAPLSCITGPNKCN